MYNLIRKVYDTDLPDSWATRLRKKRFSLFTSILESMPCPIKILDVGGTVSFWENLGFLNEGNKNVEITLLICNIYRNKLNTPKDKASCWECYKHGKLSIQ